MNIIAVFLGGGIGAVLRYIISLCFFELKFLHIPITTLSVNILASLILGLCFSIFQTKTSLPPSIKLALTCGFCGGLSTFSTFAIETLHILEINPINAIFYSIISVILCTLSVFIGIWVGKFF